MENSEMENSGTQARKEANAGKSTLTIIPCTLEDANVFVRLNHRHHGTSVGHKFSLAVVDAASKIRGVCIVGRPVARSFDDGWCLEVLRVATDGCPNACSALYGAARRATFALGYRRLITYILDTEPGQTLTASGWKCIGAAGGGSWSCQSRPRVDKAPTQMKLLWEAGEPDTPSRILLAKTLSK